MSVFRGVANILGGGALDVRKPLLEDGNDLLGLVQAQCRLGEVENPVRIGYRNRFGFLAARYDDRVVGGLPRSAHNLVMVTVADEQDCPSRGGKTHSFLVNLRDERTGGVDNLKAALPGVVPHRGSTPCAL